VRFNWRSVACPTIANRRRVLLADSAIEASYYATFFDVAVTLMYGACSVVVVVDAPRRSVRTIRSPSLAGRGTRLTTPNTRLQSAS
jgi:hypothetical protein